MFQLRRPGHGLAMRRSLLAAAISIAALAVPLGGTSATTATTATRPTSIPSPRAQALTRAHLRPASTTRHTAAKKTKEQLAGRTTTTTHAARQVATSTFSTSSRSPQSLSGPGAVSDLNAYGPVGFDHVPLSSDTMSMAITPDGLGAWMLSDDGTVKVTGDAIFQGDGTGTACIDGSDFVAIASTGSGYGYWLTTSDGCIVAVGDAQFYPETDNNAADYIETMRATPDAKGFYMVDEFGDLLTFGDAAQGLGDTGGIYLNADITSMGVMSDNAGYWFMAADGGVFPFGSSQQHAYGSAGNLVINGPMIDFQPTSDSNGYWMLSTGGSVYHFGDAASFGDLGSSPIFTSSMAGTSTKQGYWLAGFDGSLTNFGDAAALPGDTDYVVGSFYSPQNTATASDFTATIDWGDGSSSSGHIEGIGGFVVTGEHTYQRASYWRMTLHVSDTAGDSATASDIGLSSPLTGYWMVAADGGIFPFGDMPGLGSTGNVRLNQPIVGMASTSTGLGYWMVASDGGIFPFGDATRGLGSTGNVRLNQPIVGMASTPDDGGYWLVASDGGIFPFGDAGGYGSTGGMRLNKPIVGMAATPDGGGYWLVASDGGIFPFGDAARGLGSTGNVKLNQPIVGMAATPDGDGYWLVAADGGIFPFGDATPGLGSTGNIRLNKPIVGMQPSFDGEGYWLVASDGGIFPFGDATQGLGSTGNIRLNQPIVGMNGY